ncbi:MAG TPA: hypothetical protein VF746_04930 [Longimicrobium sp.]|jgi:hypothetical protein
MRAPLLFLASAAALLSAAAPVRAQTHRATVLRQLDAVATQQRARGFLPDARVLNGGTQIGLLQANGLVMLEIPLRTGARYFVMGVCDSDCEDLDLRAVGSNARTALAEDVGDDDVPVLTFTARETGPHLLTVSMAKCKTDLCYFGVRVFSSGGGR